MKNNFSPSIYKFLIWSFLFFIFSLSSSNLIAQNYYYALENRNTETQIYTHAQFVAAFSKPTPVETFGDLRVSGNKIVGKTGELVQLYGMSLFWSQWVGKYWNPKAIEWLAKDWKATVIRAPLAADAEGGYLENPASEMAKMKAVIEACIENGLYVIVDWHSHHAHNYTKEASAFFKEIAMEYGKYPNVLFEPYNEPLPGTYWDSEIKPYLETIIAVIRQYSNNLILAGSENFSAGRGYSKIINNPLKDSNVAYSLHFYAASSYTYNNTPQLNSDNFLKAGFPIFVTEYGTVEDNGNGPLDYAVSQEWWDWMDKNQISSANWAVSDAPETSAALWYNAPANGGWTAAHLTPSGIIVRDQIRKKYPLGNFETAITGIIKDSSTNLSLANIIYPKGWIIIATDTGLTKTADGFNVYSNLTIP